MKRQPSRLSLKKETLVPLAGGQSQAFVGVNTPANTHQDCTSPFCGPTTCPASCDCQTGARDQEEMIRH